MNNADIDINDPVDVNEQVREILAKQHCIAAIWSTDDVRSVRPRLTEQQAWEVLQEVDNLHDAESGINWSTLETAADDLFPTSTNRRRKP